MENTGSPCVLLNVNGSASKTEIYTVIFLAAPRRRENRVLMKGTEICFCHLGYIAV